MSGLGSKTKDLGTKSPLIISGFHSGPRFGFPGSIMR